jgi:hypothetical protein
MNALAGCALVSGAGREPPHAAVASGNSAAKSQRDIKPLEIVRVSFSAE